MLDNPWSVSPVQILTRCELSRVVADLTRRTKRARYARMNRAIFRLACCCGLRVSEISGLRLGDVVEGVSRPHLRVREGTKGGRPRIVPLWWDAPTLEDLMQW